MKRGLLTMVVALICAMTCAFGLVACNNDEEQTVVKFLKDSPEGMQINTLTFRTGLAVNKLCSLLFELEMKGVVTPLAGGSYRLLS